MATFELSIHIEGVEEVSNFLDLRGRRADDLSPAFANIATYMMERIDQNFVGLGSLFGSWPARKKEPGWPMMNRTGRMKGGFTKMSDRKQVIIGNDTPYFKFHQSRAPRSSNLPRRIMLGVDEASRREIVRRTHKYVMLGEQP